MQHFTMLMAGADRPVQASGASLVSGIAHEPAIPVQALRAPDNPGFAIQSRTSDLTDVGLWRDRLAGGADGWTGERAGHGEYLLFPGNAWPDRRGGSLDPRRLRH